MDGEWNKFLGKLDYGFTCIFAIEVLLKVLFTIYVSTTVIIIHLLHCVDTGLRLGAAPGLVPEGDVELHGPDRRLLRDHLIYNGHDVRFRYQNFSRN